MRSQPTAEVRDFPELAKGEAPLARYSAPFATAFRRADQLRWFKLYLRGLLDGAVRKNVESIAAHAVSDAPESAGLSQALQHFISNSPWDANRVTTIYRDALPDEFRGPGVWVVHDGVIEKKGRHSVGTQRQFARSLGRKVNCQLAVVVGRFGAFGYVPLAVRLYLPRILAPREPLGRRKDRPGGVAGHPRPNPVSHSNCSSNSAAKVGGEGVIVAEDGYAADERFRDALAPHALQLAVGKPPGRATGGGIGVRATQARIRSRPLRGPHLGRVAPPHRAGYCGARVSSVAKPVLIPTNRTKLLKPSFDRVGIRNGYRRRRDHVGRVE